MKLNESGSKQKTHPTVEPTPHVGFKTKLLVLILMVLIISSGSLYYVQVPLSYYGFLGASVFIILVILFLIIYFTKGTSGLFPKKVTMTDAVGVDEDAIPNPGLEKVLKAEKKYENKLKKAGKLATGRNKPHLGTGDSTHIDGTDSEDTGKGRRIGSIPLDESISREKLKISKKEDKKKVTKKNGKVTTFLCPSCGSKELYYEAGLISGYKYHCKDCDYIGSFVIEKDFKVDSSE